MGKIRKHAPHIFWTPEEVAILKAHYPTMPMPELMAMLPGREIRATASQANWLGLARVKVPKRTAEETREAKRKHMAEKRAKDPEGERAKKLEWVKKNREQLNQRRREWHGKRFFYVRARRMPGVTAKDLAAIWKRQRGFCALTGARLGRTAELDHKLPQARGGKHELDNLRWVTAEVNRAKRDLTDAEFLALCQSCARWIGERIETVEAVAAIGVAA